MPLQTFLNLDETRRKEILKIAYEEFAFNNYLIASLSTIIKKSGVAKGSFYRYFENKLDLYTYLIQNAFKLRMGLLSKLLENETLSFFEIIRENFRDKIIFDLEHPQESIFLHRALQESNVKETGTVVNDLVINIIKFTSSLIKKHQQKGELNSEISPDVVAHLIYQSQLSIYDYMAKFKGVDFMENIKNGNLFSLSEEEIMGVVDEILLLVKNGLKY